MKPVYNRIISTVPSQTELLHYLGLGDRVVGITKFCVHPEEWFRNKERVGGTKTLKLDKIAALQPDLILANKEENEKEQIEELQKKHNVHVTDIYNLDDAFEMIRAVGQLTNTGEKANQLVFDTKKEFLQLFDSILKSGKEPFFTCAYFIWKKPYMVAATNTFIDDLLTRCGLQNAFSNLSRYPEVTAEQLKQTQPDIILLSSEPYPFKEKHIEEFKQLCPKAKIQVVDGEMFSWYGSRLLLAPNYFKSLNLNR